jgi:hypothetical protein
LLFMNYFLKFPFCTCNGGQWLWLTSTPTNQFNGL